MKPTSQALDGALGDRVTVGITDYAQEQLSEIVHVHLPAVGTAVTGAEPTGEVESTKSVSDRYSRASGTVVARNDTARQASRAAQRRPLRAELDDRGPDDRPGQLDQLMDAEAYARTVAEA